MQKNGWYFELPKVWQVAWYGILIWTPRGCVFVKKKHAYAFARLSGPFQFRHQTNTLCSRTNCTGLSRLGVILKNNILKIYRDQTGTARSHPTLSEKKKARGDFAKRRTGFEIFWIFWIFLYHNTFRLLGFLGFSGFLGIFLGFLGSLGITKYMHYAVPFVKKNTNARRIFGISKLRKPDHGLIWIQQSFTIMKFNLNMKRSNAFIFVI